MFSLKIFLAFLVVGLSALNYAAYTKSTSGDNVAVITDPTGGRGSVPNPANGSTDSSNSTATSLNASLSWIAPLARENGEPLAVTEIGGYEIRYAKEGSASPSYIRVEPNKTDYTLKLSSKGEYWFSVAAYDADGVYSGFSDRVTKIIN